MHFIKRLSKRCRIELTIGIILALVISKVIKKISVKCKDKFGYALPDYYSDI
jgi:hypothetical protein